MVEVKKTLLPMRLRKNMNIETTRLRLRYFQEKDAENLFAYLSCPTVNCFAQNVVNTVDQALDVIRKRQQSQDYIAVCLKDTDELIGELFFMPEEDSYSVGWNFNTAYHGHGYASESVRRFYDYLFHELNIRRIFAYVEVDNFPSQRLCERLGMRQEGHFKEFISFVNYPDGTLKYEDTLQYAILKKEWVLQHH